MIMTSFPISIARTGWNNLFPRLKSSISHEMLQWRPDFSRETLILPYGREKTIIRSIFFLMYESCSVSRAAAKGKEKPGRSWPWSVFDRKSPKSCRSLKKWHSKTLRERGGLQKLVEVLGVIWDQLITQLKELSSGKAGDRSRAAWSRSQSRLRIFCLRSFYSSHLHSIWEPYIALMCLFSKWTCEAGKHSFCHSADSPLKLETGGKILTWHKFSRLCKNQETPLTDQ